MEAIEKICEKCEHHISVFEDNFGVKEAENARFICSSEKYGIRRELYCSNGYSCEVLKKLGNQRVKYAPKAF